MASMGGAVLGSLLLSAVRPGAEGLLRRALGWARDLGRLGVSVALPVVHDVGLLLSTSPSQYTLGPRRAAAAALAGHATATQTHARYAAAIAALAQEPTVEEVRRLQPSDDLVVVLLARLFGSGRDAEPRGDDAAHADLASIDLEGLDRRLPTLFAEAPRERELEGLERFTQDALRLRVVLDTLDLDTLQLLSTLSDHGAEAAASAFSGLQQVELLAALSSISANDVVNFSLELLPAVLETSRRTSAGTHAVSGYLGLTRRGSLDSLVLTELAWDDEELSRRLLDDEVLFYARERSEDAAARLHLILVDASASMRGDRTTFARGVAIALAKRLELEGEEARVRFFDARLYEAFGGARAGGRRAVLATALPNILAFQGERGRSPERVLRQLLAELEVLRTRDRRAPVVHLVTHAAFYAPRALMVEVRARASVFGVFITPRAEGDEPAQLELDWLDVLDGHFTVDHLTLADRAQRAQRGREIVRAIPRGTP